MNISYDWLCALAQIDWTPEQVRDVITARCAPVDEVVALRADLAPIVIARVVTAEPHPNSDHLWVTKVDAGTGELLDVVCGAPNVQAGRLYPFAPVGAVLPGGLKLERRKIRGAVSNGMLCSPRELGLGADHAGIMELSVDAAPGTRFLDAVPVGDTRIVVDVTPNRPDLLSHIGIAREVAAAAGRSLAVSDLRGVAAVAIPAPVRADVEAATAGGRVRVRLDDARGAPRYVGAVVRGVRVGPSPEWLVTRLEAVGSRSINNVVDVTNYLLHETGQPMHAFDLAKLGGGAVIVRRARAGERLVTLDGVQRQLTPEMTVIADAERAHAIAGVMGGADSEVGEGTTDVFLEVAIFEPARIRSTRRSLGISTDASYRFERGVDPELPANVIARSLQLLVDVSGGTVDGAPVDLYPHPEEQRYAPLRIGRVHHLLGERIERLEIARLLESIGFEVLENPGADTLTVRVPSWRRDIEREVDLIEEVARLRGYDSFSDVLRPYRLGNVPDSPLAIVSRRVSTELAAAGLYEARPLPFVAGGAAHVRVQNPLSEDEAYLRRDVLEALARRAEHNLTRMQGNVRLFEIGSAFHPAGAMPLEELRVGALIMGARRPAHFTEPKPPAYDEWDARALGERIAAAAFPGAAIEMDPGDGERELWRVMVDGVVVGRVERVALDAPVWASPAYGIEVRLATLDASPVLSRIETTPSSAEHTGDGNDAVAAGRAGRVPYTPLPSTPAAEIDLALVLPATVSAAQVELAIVRGGGDLLEHVELFDEYRGSGVPAGHRSVAWRLTFRHPERTLRDKEVEARRDRLLRILETELGVRQRTS